MSFLIILALMLRHVGFGFAARNFTWIFPEPSNYQPYYTNRVWGLGEAVTLSWTATIDSYTIGLWSDVPPLQLGPVKGKTVCNCVPP